MKRILVPSNCDLESERALKLASELSLKFHAKIYVLRVIKTHGGAYFNSEGEIVEDGATDVQIYKDQMMAQKQNLGNWVDKISPNAVQLIQYGGIANTILNAINELNINLVIMGNRFSEDDEHRYFGTLTDYLIKSSSAPILSLKAEMSNHMVNDIVFANEFNTNNNFFDALQDIHQWSKATVHLLRINTPKSTISEETIYVNMDRFAQDNGIENYQKHIHKSDEIEAGIIEWTSKSSFPLLAVKNISKSSSPLFRPKLSKKFFVRSSISTLIYND